MALVLTVLFVLTLAGCGGGDKAAAPAEGDKKEAPAKTQVMVIGTGDVGGTFYPVGSAVAKIMNDNVPGVKVTVESTGGSVDNARMVASGELQFGMCMGDIASNALNGKDPFKEPGPKITSLFATYSSVSQWVVNANSGIKSFADMKGKSIAVGMPASGSEVVSGMVIKAAGIDYPNAIKPQYIGVAEGANGVRDGQIDVAHQIGGVPTGGYLDLAQTKDVKFISMTDDIINKVHEQAPFYTKMIIPANTYKGQTEDVASIGVKCLFIANADVSEEMAYNIVKAIWENMDTMRASHATLKAMTPEFVASDLPVPLHPGAAKYWKEKGILK